MRHELAREGHKHIVLQVLGYIWLPLFIFRVYSITANGHTVKLQIIELRPCK